MATDAAIGSYLVRLREEEELSQKGLAGKIGMSPTLLSRTESGERSMTPDELNRALTAIGSEAAEMFKETVGRVWECLPKPPPGHPGEPILWEAEQVLREIESRLRDDILVSTANLLSRLKDELHRAARLVAGTEHRLAFVGQIGVGKSTAICRAAGLEIHDKERGVAVPVLECGGGNVTICAVRLKEGLGYGIQIEPMGREEIEREVREFAVLLKEQLGPSDDDGDGSAAFGTTREIERAIRNMTGLTRKVRGLDDKAPGKYRDPAKDLAESSVSTDTLSIEVMAKMGLDSRRRRDIWYSPEMSEDPLTWVKANFEKINNGRHPDFSIPKLVTVTVPRLILDETSFSIELVDTKGIDRTAERSDLEDLFSDPNTAVVMCSRFADIPASPIQQLLERARQNGHSSLEHKGVVLGLVRPDEVWSVKDDTGIAAESVETGYELKGDDAQITLQSIGFSDLRVEFFNAKEDSSDGFREVLRELVRGLRGHHQSELQSVINDAHSLFENFQGEEQLEVMRMAADHIRSWLDSNRVLETSKLGSLERRLLRAIRREHPSTVRASVRREGEWGHFEYPYYLRIGVRSAARDVALNKFERLREKIDELSEVESLAKASSLLGDIRRTTNAGIADLEAKCNLLGNRIHSHHMKKDSALWDKCDKRWGRGSGYRDDVATYHEDWFDTQDFRTEMAQLIQQVWDETFASLDQALIIE